MNRKDLIIAAIGGAFAGAANGLLGAGGGMILVPFLTQFANLKENEIFPSSVSIILPICLISLVFSADFSVLKNTITVPCLLGSAVGGIAAGLLGKRIPTLWLHRILGLMILWGGVRFLC